MQIQSDCDAEKLIRLLFVRQSNVNKSFYYWLFFQSFIPHYQFLIDDTQGSLSTLSTRFVFLLQSIDNMGINYFQKIDNETEDNIQYHFNYFISLITGIFDSLSRTTKIAYNILPNQKINSQNISLRKPVGKIFLKEIKNHNFELHQLISNNVDFINLIYKFRELVIHQDFQPSVTFSSLTGKNKSSLLRIPDFLIREIHSFFTKNKMENSSSLNETPIGYLLSPYDFSKEIRNYLFIFVDEYLKYLGCSFHCNQNSQNENYLRIQSFKKRSLILL